MSDPLRNSDQLIIITKNPEFPSHERKDVFCKTDLPVCARSIERPLSGVLQGHIRTRLQTCAKDASVRAIARAPPRAVLLIR